MGFNLEQEANELINEKLCYFIRLNSVGIYLRNIVIGVAAQTLNFSRISY